MGKSAVLVAVLIVGACTFNKSGLPVSEKGYYGCDADLNWEQPVNLPLLNKVTRFTAPSNETYSSILGFLQDKQTLYKPYREVKNWVVESTNYPKLKGANLVRTNFSDRGVTGPDQLSIDWVTDSDELYVCYDSRASRKPDWLTGAFTQMRDQNKNTLFTVTITMPDKSKSPPGPSVDMEVLGIQEQKELQSQ